MLVQSNPDKHSYGTPGIGTLHHLSVELLKKQARLAIQHVDLMGGHIGIGVTSATAALGQAKGGKQRIVGLTSRARIASAPDIPTIAEALPGYEVTNDLFVLAPAGTPIAIVSTLGTALTTVLAAKAMQESYLAQGAVIEWSSPEDLATRIGRDVATLEERGEGRWHPTGLIDAGYAAIPEPAFGQLPRCADRT